MKETALKIIKELKEYNELFVIGHNNIDSDSFFSSYLLSKILQSFGINAKQCILEDYQILEDDRGEIETFKKEDPIVLTKEEIKDKTFILVDHNDPDQSLKTNDANIVLSIDHHIVTNKVKNCYSIEYTSTGLFLYDLFKEIYSFSQEEKDIIALTVITDSCFLMTSRYKESDKVLMNELRPTINAEDLRKKYFKTTDFSQDMDYLIHNNHKVYHVDDFEINRVIMKGNREDREKVQRIIQRSNELYPNNLFIWNEYDSKHTMVYYKGSLLKEYDLIITSSMLITKDLIKEIKD